MRPNHHGIFCFRISFCLNHKNQVFSIGQVLDNFGIGSYRRLALKYHRFLLFQDCLFKFLNGYGTLKNPVSCLSCKANYRNPGIAEVLIKGQI